MTDNSRTRRHWRWLSLVAVANLAVVGLAATPSQARGVSLCNGTVEGRTIFGDLAVPAGQSCLLLDSRVLGDVEVRQDANLTLEDSSVWGGLTVRANGFVDSIGSAVGSTVRLREAFGGVLEGSVLWGRLEVTDSGFLISDGSTHRSDLVSTNGQTVILSSRFSDDVRTTGDRLTDLRDAVVAGRLVVERAEFGSVICRSEIDRYAVVRDSTDLVQLGDGTFTGCEFNVFGADLELRDNLADLQINGNVIRDDLDCTGNDPVPTGVDNRIRGEATGQCADLTAPAAAPLSTPVPLESRLAGVTGAAAARAAAAQSAAEAAGPAGL